MSGTEAKDFDSLVTKVAEERNPGKKVALYFQHVNLVPTDKIVESLNIVLNLAVENEVAAIVLVNSIKSDTLGPFHYNICNSDHGILSRFAIHRLNRLKELHDALNVRQPHDKPSLEISRGLSLLTAIIFAREAEEKAIKIRAPLLAKLRLNLTDDVKKQWNAQEPKPTATLVAPDTRDFTQEGLVSASVQEGKLVSVTLDVKTVESTLSFNNNIYTQITKTAEDSTKSTVDKLTALSQQVKLLLAPKKQVQASLSASPGPTTEVKKPAGTNLSSFMGGPGDSDHRHAALLNAYVLSRLIKDGKLDKSCEVIHVQTEILPPSATQLFPHSVILFKDEKGQYYIVDASRSATLWSGFIGFSSVLAIPHDDTKIAAQYGFSGTDLLKVYAPKPVPQQEIPLHSSESGGSSSPKKVPQSEEEEKEEKEEKHPGESFEDVKKSVEIYSASGRDIIIGYFNKFDRMIPDEQIKALKRVFELCCDSNEICEDDVMVMVSSTDPDIKKIINDNIKRVDELKFILGFAERYPSIAEQLFPSHTKSLIGMKRTTSLIAKITTVNVQFKEKKHPTLVSIFNISAANKIGSGPSIDTIACKIVKLATEAEKHPTVGFFCRQTISPDDITATISPIFDTFVHTDQANLNEVKKHIEKTAGTAKFSLRGGFGDSIDIKDTQGQTRRVRVPHRVAAIYRLINSPGNTQEKAKKIIKAAAEARAHGRGRQSDGTKQFYEAVIKSLLPHNLFKNIDVDQMELEEKPKRKLK